MRTPLRFFAVFALLAVCGCPLEPPPKPPAPAAGKAAPSEGEATPTASKPLPKPPADAPVYEVVCGCSIKEVGKCGEWALVDGKHVPLSDLGLGSMPFCGKSGLKARIAGEIKAGKLEATAFELLE